MAAIIKVFSNFKPSTTEIPPIDKKCYSNNKIEKISSNNTIPLIRINEEAIATFTHDKVGAGLCSGVSSASEVKLATKPYIAVESISYS
jgi:hypothetical protein